MMIQLHKNATTTPATRRYIQQSDKPVSQLAKELGISQDTVRRWKHRADVYDRSHTPHRKQTTLSPAQERVVVELRKTLLLPLDDMLVVVREFIYPNMSRSALSRLLVRHQVGNLNDLKPKIPKPEYKPFKAYQPGYIHIDIKYLPQMADEDSHGYLFVAIDRATRWVYHQIMPNKTAASARAFLDALKGACPIRIRTILTDNGKEFTDRLFGVRQREATGKHEFDRLCQALGIEHRLTKPRRPQTNGMVERFNGRISDILRTHRFDDAKDLAQTLKRYVWLYNHQLPQKALDHQTPIHTMK